jgi:hypothetical protein
VFLVCESNGYDYHHQDHGSGPGKKADAVDDQRYRRMGFVEMHECFHRLTIKEVSNATSKVVRPLCRKKKIENNHDPLQTNP